MFAASKPLKDILVLDFSRLLPGPFATHQLATIGAKVIKIESPDKPDYASAIPPLADDKSYAWHLLNHQKENRVFDFQKDAGKLKTLIEKADVLIESFRPGEMAKYKLDYKSLKAINSKLVYASITGYGQDSILASHAGHDINYLALSGVLEGQGEGQEGPVLNQFQLADIAGGSLITTAAVCAALFQREREQTGSYLDISMTHSMLTLNPVADAFEQAGIPLKRGEGFLGGGHPAYGIYQSKDGKNIALGCMEIKFWKTFCQSLNLDWEKRHGDFKQFASLKEDLKKLFSQKNQNEWWDIFKDKDCCCTPVLSKKEAMEFWGNEFQKTFNLGNGKELVQFSFPV